MKKKVANAPAVAKSKLSEGDAVTVVCMAPTCNVTYEFDTSATNSDLALRYMVSINGRVLPNKGDTPRVLDGSRKFNVSAHPGNTVALFLNSDVHPDFRSHPVYAVKVGDNDVHIKITERTGRNGNFTSVLGAPEVKKDPKSDKEVDVYKAFLTGDIWMEISHSYTAEEAEAFLPEDTDELIRDAVLSIFRGLPNKELVIKFPKCEKTPAHKMRVCFAESENASENTTYCPLLASVLPRTHPRAYAALFTEARAAEVTELHVTSGWRPMLGSIAHRAGLGLDINYAESATEKVQINRVSLTNPKLKRNDNVSEREQDLYVAYQDAKKCALDSDTKLSLAQKSVKLNRDPKEAKNLKEFLAKAEAEKSEAFKLVAEKRKEWNKERDQNELGLIHTLREKLGHNNEISQVLDPWYMNLNTKGTTPAQPNEQKNSAEKVHNNHLHITITDRKLL